MTRVFVRWGVSRDIKEYIQGKDHFYVTSVANVLPGRKVSRHIKELTQERNPLHVTSATKVLFNHLI